MKKIILTIFLLTFCVSISGAGITDKLRAVIAAKNAGAPAAGAPDFIEEIQRGEITNDSNPIEIVLSAGVSTGVRLVLLVSSASDEEAVVSGVTDDGSNTWAVDVTHGANDDHALSIISTEVTSALSSSDSIFVTFAVAQSYTSKIYFLVTLSDTTSNDSSASGGAYGTAVSASASTTAAATTIVGMIYGADSVTYGSGNWTTVGAYQDGGATSYRAYLVRTTESSSGTKAPGGAWSDNNAHVEIWSAYD